MLTDLPLRRLAVWAILCLLTLPGRADAQQSSPASSPASSPGGAAAYSSAAALQDQGLYDLAAKEWLALLKAHPTDPLAARARYNLGACRFQQGNFAAAAEQFEQAAGAKGGQQVAESAWANLGLARFNLAASLPAEQSAEARGAYQGAIEAFDKLLADYPQTNQSGAARFYRAESHAALGEPKAAAEDYQAVLVEASASTLHDGARLGLASAELDLDQPQQAEATLNSLVAAKPAAGVMGEALRLRGEARLATKRYAEAAKDFDQASGIAGYAAAADARERQAFALYSGGDYTGAAGAYQELAKQFPQSPLAAGAQLAAGKCLVLGKQSDEAAFLLGALWRANPSADNAEAAHWLAQTLLGARKWGEASEVAQQALDTQPADQWAMPLKLALADALVEQPGRQAEALAVYQALAKEHAKTPTGERAEYLAAYAALELGQNDLAWQLASGFLKQRPQHELTGNARQVAAEAATRLGKSGEAADLYKELLQGAPSDPHAGDWALRMASSLSDSKDPQAVIELLSPRVDSLTGAPREQALRMLAEAHQASGDAAASERTLTRLIAESKDADRRARARYQRGELRLASSKQAEAIQDFSQLVTDSPTHELAPYALYAVASQQASANQPQQAEETLRRLLADYKSGPLGQARFLLANLLQQSGQHDEALALLDAAEAPDAEKLYLRGMSLAGKQDAAGARQAFEQFLKEHAGHALGDRVLYERAWLDRQTKPDRALAMFIQLVRDYPQSPLAAEASLRAGELLYAQKQYDKAASALGHAAKLSAANASLRAQALHLGGWARFDAGQFGPALKAFRAQLEAEPAGPLAADGKVMIGECLFAAKDYAEALAAYDESLTVLPKNQELATLALLHAGQSAAQVGNWVESLDWLDRASKANGEGAKQDEIQYERGWAMVNLKRPAGAKPIFEKLVESSDGVLGARSRFMLGELQFADKEYDKAVRTFFRVAYGYGGRDAPREYHPWQSESLFEAARCLEELGRQEPAAKLYTELLERFPECPKARHAEARLQAGVSR